MNKNTLLLKLKSNRGASLSIALLLFLVCTVLGSVILRSGTAASGRVANMAEADARYYSVTSAADYLADAITTAHIPASPTSAATNTARTVTVTRTATTTSTEVSHYLSEEWIPVPARNVPETTNYSIPDISDNTTSGTAETILTKAVKDLFFDGSPLATEDCWEKDRPGILKQDGSAGSKEYDFSLLFSALDADSINENLKVYVHEVIRSNGDIVLTISDAGSDDEEGYRIEMVFLLTSKTTVSSQTKTVSSTTGSEETDNLYLSEETTTVQKKTTSCFWTLSEIRKVN